jgi:predicted CXXCH cytochrome family protein
MATVRTNSLSVLLLLLAALVAWAAKDSCFECHMVQKGPSPIFKDDVHYKYGISCANCHGGDPNEERANDSMSDARGMKPRVMREDVPDFCGTCHSDAAFMRKYKPGQRVDQLALYRKSVHGVQFAKGNKKAAQCVDCHGVHNTRAVSDPQSVVYLSRLADKCGACHGEVARLFKQSPHAKVFTTSAMAACSVCHSSHGTEQSSVAMLTGAKPVCARCHPANSAAGKQVAAMAKSITGLAPKAQRKSAMQAVHALKLAP